MVADPNQFLGCQSGGIFFTAINSMNYSDKKYGLDDHGIYDLVNKTIGRYYPLEISYLG